MRTSRALMSMAAVVTISVAGCACGGGMNAQQVYDASGYISDRAEELQLCPTSSALPMCSPAAINSRLATVKSRSDQLKSLAIAAGAKSAP